MLFSNHMSPLDNRAIIKELDTHVNILTLEKIKYGTTAQWGRVTL